MTQDLVLYFQFVDSRKQKHEACDLSQTHLREHSSREMLLTVCCVKEVISMSLASWRAEGFVASPRDRYWDFHLELNTLTKIS